MKTFFIKVKNFLKIRLTRNFKLNFTLIDDLEDPMYKSQDSKVAPEDAI